MARQPSKIREEIEATRADMSETADALSYKVDVPARLHDAVSSSVESAKANMAGAADTVSSAAAGAKDQLTSAASATTQQLADAAQATGTGLRNNPLAMVGGAFAMGVLAGLVLPMTARERQTMGPLRDTLMEQASAVGETALAEGKQAASETVRAAAEQARTSALEHGQAVLDAAAGKANASDGYHGVTE